MIQEFFEALQTAEALTAIFLVFGALFYIAGTVIYNVLLVRERRSRREKPDPPTARVEAIVYPDEREEAREK